MSASNHLPAPPGTLPEVALFRCGQSGVYALANDLALKLSDSAQNVKLQLASRITFRSVNALTGHDQGHPMRMNSSINCAKCESYAPSLSSLKHDDIDRAVTITLVTWVR